MKVRKCSEIWTEAGAVAGIQWIVGGTCRQVGDAQSAFDAEVYLGKCCERAAQGNKQDTCDENELFDHGIDFDEYL